MRLLTMISVGSVYVGLVAVFLGAVSVIKLLSFLGIHGRSQAAVLFALGSGFVVLGWVVPTKEEHVAAIHSALDEFVPLYQFDERHSILIRAPKERVYHALKLVGS